MGKIGTVIVKEIREALPAMIFFLFLFHMIALTRAVSIDDYSITALRAVGATVGALIVAKAILIVEALPISRLSSNKPAVQVLWKTVLYSIVVFLFKVVEEAIPLLLKHQSLMSATKAMYHEVSWPLFVVLALWIIGGLFFYCSVSELVRIIGPGRTRKIFFGTGNRKTDK
jgi:hypothetical protein